MICCVGPYERHFPDSFVLQLDPSPVLLDLGLRLLGELYKLLLQLLASGFVRDDLPEFKSELLDFLVLSLKFGDLVFKLLFLTFNGSLKIHLHVQLLLLQIHNLLDLEVELHRALLLNHLFLNHLRSLVEHFVITLEFDNLILLWGVFHRAGFLFQEDFLSELVNEFLLLIDFLRGLMRVIGVNEGGVTSYSRTSGKLTVVEPCGIVRIRNFLGS